MIVLVSLLGFNKFTLEPPDSCDITFRGAAICPQICITHLLVG